MNHTYLNNDFLPAGHAALRVSDLSIQRGYGIFDFFKTVDSRPVFLDDHLDRFFHSADRMRLPVGKTREELKTIFAELIRLNNIPDSGIRITLTGGYSPDGYSIAQPNLIITQIPLPIPGRECVPPIRLISYPHQRQIPDVKTIDYLMAIHLQPHIRERGATDVLYHYNGVVTECPRSNFFLVTADNTLVTPARNMLKGITRSKILGFAAANSKVEERDVLLAEIPGAKEAFISATGRHLVPVSHIDDQPVGREAAGDQWVGREAADDQPVGGAAAGDQPVGGGRMAGPITAELNAMLYRLVTSGK
ncbi:MAG TPA: aminotransferase class IV [Puia sp.]|jgi:D-alanine transaminase/branched-chain amino acid aminotransferase|nr:aminotransferase class IV [Puia sp.]